MPAFFVVVVIVTEARENLENLLAAIDVVMTGILENRKAIPGSFRRMCHHLKKESSRKLVEEGLQEEYMWAPFFFFSSSFFFFLCFFFLFFFSPQSTQCSLRLVGSFIFLRFFCPALTTPQLYGVTERTQFSPEERRGLIVVAKVFIGLGADSDLAAKEEYMSPLNQRLGPQKEKMKEYLTFVSSVGFPPLKLSRFLAIPNPPPLFFAKPVAPRESMAIRKDPEQFEKTISVVISFLNKNMKKIEELVQGQDALMSQLEEIKGLLEHIDMPSTPQSATRETRSPTIDEHMFQQHRQPSPQAEKRKLLKTFTDFSDSNPANPTGVPGPGPLPKSKEGGKLKGILKKGNGRTNSLDNLDLGS